jgi:hypothetical protein
MMMIYDADDDGDVDDEGQPILEALVAVDSSPVRDFGDLLQSNAQRKITNICICMSWFPALIWSQ